MTDVVDNGANWQQTLNTTQANCTSTQIDPAQWSKATALAEVEATISAVHTIASILQPLSKAVIINAGARLTDDPDAALIPFNSFYERFDNISNLLWCADGHCPFNARKALQTYPPCLVCR